MTCEIIKRQISDSKCMIISDSVHVVSKGQRRLENCRELATTRSGMTRCDVARLVGRMYRIKNKRLVHGVAQVVLREKTVNKVSLRRSIVTPVCSNCEMRCVCLSVAVGYVLVSWCWWTLLEIARRGREVLRASVFCFFKVFMNFVDNGQKERNKTAKSIVSHVFFRVYVM